MKSFKRQDVSFSNVATFNNVSFVGLSPEAPQSVRCFMWRNLFKYIDIDPANVYILNGSKPNLEEECKNFENKLKEIGPAHLFVSGEFFILLIRDFD